MAKDTITSMTSGAFYTGPMDTVYFKASVQLTGASTSWASITLDKPYVYDPAKSLIVMVGQCGASGSGWIVRQNTMTQSRRIWSVGGCPFTPYASQDFNIVNFGVDVTSASSPTYYSSQWCPPQRLPDMPAGQYFNAAAWLGDTMYVQSPAAGVAATTIYRYTYGGTWSTGVPIPSAKIGGTLTAVNGKLYYAGGGGASGITVPTTDLYEYTPSTGTWVTKAPIPLAIAAHGAANWGDSVLFVFSGVYSAPVTNVYAYRPATDTWVSSTVTPFARRTFAYGISGNKLLMAGGYNGGYMKDFAYGTIGANATTITWTTGPQIPVGYAGISRPGGTAFADRFYVVGGERSVGLQSDSMWIYSISTNTWTGFGGKPTAVSNMCASVTSKKINDTVKVFVAGGYLASAVGTPNLDFFGCGPTLTGIVWNQQSAPTAYKLSQNYPNPFNPVTKINYALPKSGFVTLKVYDMLGREVVSLVNENKVSGNYSVDFNASSLTSGVYFYRLEVNGFVDTKKMMLIK
jgi:hypothetical protein